MLKVFKNSVASRNQPGILGSHDSLAMRCVMRLARSLLVWTIFASATILAGCSDPNGPQAVRGFVKLEGQPLKEGSIVFVPLDKQGTQSGAGITNGEYE